MPRRIVPALELDVDVGPGVGGEEPESGTRGLRNSLWQPDSYDQPEGQGKATADEQPALDRRGPARAIADRARHPPAHQAEDGKKE
jgi:hypothetical protein